MDANILWLAVPGGCLICSLVISLLFLRERAHRAAFVSLLLFGGASLLLLVPAALQPDWRMAIGGSITVVIALSTVILFIRISPQADDAPRAAQRFDEREIMFARARYEQGSEEYQRFYRDNPELQEIDDALRSMPNLGEEGGDTWDRLNARVAESLFITINRMRRQAEGEVHGEPVQLSPEDAALRLKGMARYLGAADAGATGVHPEHVYSHIGRGTGTWGEELQPSDYPHALVFTIEMKEEMYEPTPMQPVMAESARSYLEGTMISFGVAEYIRSLGYSARAHHDGNYRLIMPTLARDAGLGEIGRHSLLITPKQGTRVRIGAVTTDMPLAADRRVAFGVQDFCSICLKCAENCPPNAIPKGEKVAARGTRYWKISPERCYRYWRRCGTDCGACVITCPYSRPAGLLHSVVRAACASNGLSRRVFARLDDLFYGRKPRSRRYPEWMKAGLTEGEIEELKIE